MKSSRICRLISNICSRAEDIRGREFRKACRYLRDIDESQRLVVEKLTRVIVDRILHNPLSNLRKASENGDAELPRVARILFCKAEGGEN
jgi:glutamyl-tRNA reductase